MDRHHGIPVDLCAARLALGPSGAASRANACMAAQGRRRVAHAAVRAAASDPRIRLAVQLGDRRAGRLPGPRPVARSRARRQGAGPPAEGHPRCIELRAGRNGLPAYGGRPQAPLCRPRPRADANAPANPAERKRWMMVLLRSFIPSLGALLLAAGQAGAQGLLIDKSEIRFISKQLGVNVEGRFRKWKANIVFLPKNLGKSKADFEIDLGSIDLASDESETEIKSPSWFNIAKFPVAR